MELEEKKNECESNTEILWPMDDQQVRLVRLRQRPTLHPISNPHVMHWLEHLNPRPYHDQCWPIHLSSSSSVRNPHLSNSSSPIHQGSRQKPHRFQMPLYQGLRAGENSIRVLLQELHLEPGWDGMMVLRSKEHLWSQMGWDVQELPEQYGQTLQILQYISL